MSLKLGMTMEEIRAIVSASDYKEYVEEGPKEAVGKGPYDTVLSEEEVLGFYTLAYYPKDILEDMKVGTQYRWYRYWITAHSQTAIYLFFDASDKLRGWANNPSIYNYEKYWHERLTSQLRIRDMGGKERGMTRAQVLALIGSPIETIEPPKQRTRAQYVNHIWRSTYVQNKSPVFGIIKKFDVYTYSIEGGEQRRVYLGYAEDLKLLSQYDWEKKIWKQVPNPDYIGPQNDELIAWGYDHVWEEGERYMRIQQVRQK